MNWVAFVFWCIICLGLVVAVDVCIKGYREQEEWNEYDEN